MSARTRQKDSEHITRYADIFAALGAENRLQIVRLLLSAHPDGMIVNEIQTELQMSGSNLSHHLEKLKNEELITVTRESTCLRYRANAEVLQEMLAFLFAECCKKNACVPADQLMKLCK
jgi:ArsR family transcriptional regulator, arsenate/arsenite/antimonite-responsive transcriptional repressor